MSLPARIFAVLALVGSACGVVGADTQFEAYRALGIEPKDVMVGTVLSADVIPDGGDEVVAVVTYFTGKKAREDALDVRLAVFRKVGKTLDPVFVRAFGETVSGNVGRGELQLVDLDRDDLDEIIVSFDDASEPLVARRRGQVLVWDGGTFATAWEGELSHDATLDARGVPPERRDRWVREIDVVRTLRSRGKTLYMTRTVYAVAGEALAAPKPITETFPFRPRASP